jgi:hypothetical protein
MVVDLVGRYSKRPDLVERLVITVARLGQKPSAELDASLALSEDRVPHAPRGRARLTDEETRRLLEGFKAGVPRYVLAEEYGISLSSVARILRAHSVTCKDRKKQG